MNWTSTGDQLPPDETPVLVVYLGEIRIAERRWERPGWEDTYSAFWYWDDPHNDGQDWDHRDVTYWAPLPDAPSPGEGTL